MDNRLITLSKNEKQLFLDGTKAFYEALEKNSLEEYSYQFKRFIKYAVDSGSADRALTWLLEYEIYNGTDDFSREYESIISEKYSIQTIGQTFNLFSNTNFNYGKKFDISIFRNKFVGQRCFVIGNGPSLNNIDASLLKDEITFGVNAIYLLRKSMGFDPTFYVVEDTHVAKDRKIEIFLLENSIKIFGHYFYGSLYDSPETLWQNVILDYRNYPEFPYFSIDAFTRMWVGGTVSYICFQLAFYMGFSEVYLIGFDHSYIVPETATVIGNDIISQADDVNHFHPDYFGKGYKWHLPRLDRMEQCYIKTKRVFEAANKRVVNSTVGGELEVFPRINFNKVIRLGKPATIDGGLAINWVANILNTTVKQHIIEMDAFCDNPDVTVIVAGIDEYENLTESLNSLCNQTHKNIEIVVINDELSDISRKVVERFGKIDPRVRMIYKRHFDLERARKTGISESKGKHYMFISPDETISPKLIDKFLNK